MRFVSRERTATINYELVEVKHGRDLLRCASMTFAIRLGSPSTDLLRRLAFTSETDPEGRPFQAGQRGQSALIISGSPSGVTWKTRALSGSDALRFRACIGAPIGSLY